MDQMAVRKRCILQDVGAVLAVLLFLPLAALAIRSSWCYEFTKALYSRETGTGTYSGTEYLFLRDGELTTDSDFGTSEAAARILWTGRRTFVGLLQSPLYESSTLVLQQIATADDDVDESDVLSFIGTHGVWRGGPPSSEMMRRLSVFPQADGSVRILPHGPTAVEHRGAVLLSLWHRFPNLFDLGSRGYVALVVFLLLCPRTLRWYWRKQRGLCVRCAYVLGGFDRCPECGLDCSGVS